MEEAENYRDYESHLAEQKARMKLGVEIYKARKGLKLDQEKFAAKLNITRERLNAIEIGSVSPRFSLLCKIFRELKINATGINNIFKK